MRKTEDSARRLSANDRRYGIVFSLLYSLSEKTVRRAEHHLKSCPAQEKQQAMERRLQELSEKVVALERDRDQLQRALNSATSGSEVQLVCVLPHQHVDWSLCVVW